MPNKHISELPEEYHDRLHFVEQVTECAANYMFKHKLKEGNRPVPAALFGMIYRC